MPKLEKKLASPAKLTTSAVAYYTVPGLRMAKLKFLHLTNFTDSTRAVTVYIQDPTTSTVALLFVKPIAGLATLTLHLDITMDATSAVLAQCDIGNSVAMFIGGYEIID